MVPCTGDSPNGLHRPLVRLSIGKGKGSNKRLKMRRNETMLVVALVGLGVLYRKDNRFSNIRYPQPQAQYYRKRQVGRAN